MKRGSFACALALLASLPVAAAAHSASDAYLTLEVDRSAARPVVHGQWDIALRDLDFVIGLDDDGDGRITWRELRAHQAAVARYALDRLSFRNGAAACKLVLTKQQVDDHADGAYAVLSFDVACRAPVERLTLAYRLFFDQDPSHRAIVVSRTGSDTATAVLSPQNAQVVLDLRTR